MLAQNTAFNNIHKTKLNNIDMCACKHLKKYTTFQKQVVLIPWCD